MGTKIYGASDDLIEFEGDIRGEVGCYKTDDDGRGALLICSDGTLLEVKYGKADLAIWQVSVVAKGSLFSEIEICDDEDAKIYSDVAIFADGLRWIYAASEWERVK